MNKEVLAVIAAGALVVGLVLAPAGPFSVFESAQAQETGATKKVTLIADELEVQIAPDNALHPGGVMYDAMVFNGTIPGPVRSEEHTSELQSQSNLVCRLLLEKKKKKNKKKN